MKETLRAVARRFLPEKHYLIALRAAKRVYYAGRSRHCPICGGHFRRFLPAGLDLPVMREKKVVGGGLTPEVVCPGCSSLNRERLLFLFLRDETRVFDSATNILHVAPEPGLSRILSNLKTARYVSMDIAAQDVKLRADLIALPFRNCTYDLVICCHVLEHVKNDLASMREILRVLKPGGWAVLQVPIAMSEERTLEDPSIESPEARELAFGQSDHVRLYGRDYKQRLEAAGFRVEVHNCATHLGADDVARYGVLNEEEIYACHRDQASLPRSLEG